MQTILELMTFYWGITLFLCMVLFLCMALYIWHKFIYKLISCFFVAPFDYDEPDRSIHAPFDL
jgi:hypothetical protein